MPIASSSRRRLVVTAATLAASVLLLGGCSSTPKAPKPTVVAATVSAAADTNPDASGRPSPIVLRIYELKALAGFNDSDFFSLWDRDQETLGADLMAREEMVLRPGDQNRLTRTAKPDTRYIAVVAAYRDLERANWRGSIAVVPNKTLALDIKLDARSVTLIASPPAAK